MALQSLSGEISPLVDWKTLADTIPQIVWTARADGVRDYFNRRWFEITGLTPEETYLDASWLRASHPDDRDALARAWQKAVASGTEYVAEYRLRQRDGTYRWFLARGVPTRSADGSVLRWYGTATDIDEQKRLYERQHRVASELQRAMLPTYLPQLDRVEFSSVYRPAERESEVGGDWYDVFVVPGGKIALSIGDVGGHGLGAAVAMSEARQSLRLSALEGFSPAETIARTNAVIAMNGHQPIITAIFGFVDVERSTFTYSCAGHPPPALLTPSGHARFLYGGGVPMGIDRRASFPTWEVKLEPFSTLLLYTDGVIEFNRDIEQECRRLLEALRRRVQDASGDGAAALLRYMLNARQLDDIALLVTTILPKRPEPVEITLDAVPASAAVARRFAARYARVARLSEERAFNLILAVGEAAANAIEHAYAFKGGPFALRLSMRGGMVIGEVRDAGTWRNGPSMPNRGRGFRIMRAITSHLRVKPSPKGTAVVLEV
jgi:PAS domain S-box-containing protein